MTDRPAVVVGHFFTEKMALAYAEDLASAFEGNVYETERDAWDYWVWSVRDHD